MYHREAVRRVTVRAEGGLGNTTSVYLDRSTERTHVAAEEGFSHFRYNVRRPDHHTADCDQLVNVCKYKLSLLLLLLQYIYEILKQLLVVKYLLTRNNSVYTV